MAMTAKGIGEFVNISSTGIYEREWGGGGERKTMIF